MKMINVFLKNDEFVKILYVYFYNVINKGDCILLNIL